MAGSRDTTRSFARDERAVTIKNGPAVGTLLLFAVLLAGGLGAGVLFAEEEDTGPPTANFTYQHFDRNSALVVTFDRGDPIPAGEILFTNDANNATWSQIAGSNNSSMVGPGDTVQLSGRSAFGSPITSSQTVRILWTGGNETVELGRWPNEESGSGL